MLVREQDKIAAIINFLESEHKLLIIYGLSKSGKTYITNKIKQNFNYHFLCLEYSQNINKNILNLFYIKTNKIIILVSPELTDNNFNIIDYKKTLGLDFEYIEFGLGFY